MTKFGNNHSSTTNRGVEAKEVEIANTHLDSNDTESARSARAASPAPSAPGDSSASCVQVVVQQRARRPAASSPVRVPQGGRAAGAGAGGDVLLLPASVLLARASPHALPQYKIVRERVCAAPDTAAAERESDALQSVRAPEEKIPKKTGWKILSNVNPDLLDNNENVPERVEVYYFEQNTGSYLATSGARYAPRAEAWRRRAARAAGSCGAELSAAAQLLLALPVGLLVGVERCAAAAARDVVAGGVQAAADYALKPALALAFNALLQPPLVFAANVARALREVVRPLALALGDALEPAARVLGALRLVHVRLDARACRCRADAAAV